MPSPDVAIASVSAADAESKGHIPGDKDVWIFILGDMAIFSCYFAAYLFLDRRTNHGLFLEAQQHLSQALGIVNTVILLSSSLLIALCIQSAKLGEYAAASRRLIAGGGLGVVFLFVKSYEWYAKISAGLTISSNAFFMHYYVMTGLHVMHVMVGLVFLSIMWRELRSANAPRVALLEVGGSYWHMVDFLWILIFALLYLMK